MTTNTFGHPLRHSFAFLTFELIKSLCENGIIELYSFEGENKEEVKIYARATSKVFKVQKLFN